MAHPATSLEPIKLQTVHRLRSDEEAIRAAHRVSKQLEAETSGRDRERASSSWWRTYRLRSHFAR